MSGYPVLKDTAAKLYFLMYDSAQTLPVGKADLVVGNITVTLKKLGGTWAGAAGAVTNEGEGWYSVADAANTDTAGPLLLKASAAGAVTALQTFNVVAYNSADAEDLGLSSITAAAAQATAAADFAEANNTMLGTVPADVWDHNFSGDTAANWLLGTNNLAVILEARLTLNAIRDAIWQAATSSLTVPGSIGLFIVTLLQEARDRVIIGVPSSAPGAVSGVVIRSYLDQRTSASTGTAVSAFLSMVENYSGSLYRFLAAALALAPSGGGGGGGPLADADIDWSFSARPTTGGAFILQALSVEYLKASATAFVGERQIDPTAYAVEFAFVTSSSALGAATWHECEWDENGLARLLVGPGEVELTAGAYYWYVRVTSSPETSLQRLDPILRVE